jgi:hypothetical protein
MDVLILLVFTGLFAWWGIWVSDRGETKHRKREENPPADG